jgi:universal stress protein A
MVTHCTEIKMSPTFKKLLVPVDFSDCSKAALEHAELIGRQFGASITILHVWEPPSSKIPSISLQSFDFPEQANKRLETIVFREAAMEMRDFLHDFDRDDSLEVRCQLVSGQPTEQILSLAEDGAYDLIVMGTHGRSGLAHLFMGSVTEKVLRQAPCPVLAIRHANGPSSLEEAA